MAIDIAVWILGFIGLLVTGAVAMKQYNARINDYFMADEDESPADRD